MKKLILIILMLSPLFAWANFSFDAATCSVTASGPVRFRTSDDSQSANVKVELLFRGENILLPYLRLSLTGVYPAVISVRWSKLSYERRGQRLYVPEVESAVLRAEAQALNLKFVGTLETQSVYESSILNFGDSQALVALFVAQNEFSIEYQDALGKNWTAVHDLNASDSSFRVMGAKCYPQLTAKYLKSNGERQIAVEIPATESSEKLSSSSPYWSTGYGMTDFVPVNAQLPAEFRYPAAIFNLEQESEITANKRMGSLYVAALQKIASLEQFTLATSDANYIGLSQSLDIQYKKLSDTYQRFSQLTGEGSVTEGLIAAKLNEQARLKEQIANFNLRLKQAEENREKLTETEAAAQTILDPHQKILDQFANDILLRQQVLQDLQDMESKLSAWLDQELQNLNVEQLNEAQSEALVEPWDFSEIEKRHEENDKRREQIITLEALKSQLTEIEVSIRELNTLAAQQDAAAQKYLEAALQVSESKKAFMAEEAWLAARIKVPYFNHQPAEVFAALNQEIESGVTLKNKDRGYDQEFDFHAGLYESITNSYLKAFSRAQTKGSLITGILCHPEILLEPGKKNRPCLFVDEALNEKVLEAFVQSLPPQNLDILLGQGDGPWLGELSKYDTLIRKFRAELADPRSGWAELSSAWTKLRFIIWRWVSMQAEADAFVSCGDTDDVAVFVGGTYSSAFYETVFRCERAEFEKRQNNLRELKFASMFAEGDELTQSRLYDAADNSFSLASAQFISDALAKISSIKDEIEFGRVFKGCVLPLEKAEDCESSITGGLSNISLNLENEKTNYAGLAIGLIHQIKFKLTENAGSQGSVKDEISSLTLAKDDYFAANNVGELIQSRDKLQAEVDRIAAEIADLISKIAAQTNAQILAKRQEVGFRLETLSLAQNISGLVTEIEKLLPAFKPYCASILPITEKLKSLDQSFYQIMGQAAPLSTKIYSSCERPGIESFMPSQEWAAPARLNSPR